MLGSLSGRLHGGQFSGCAADPSSRYRRTQFRRDANKADNKAAAVSVDSLINYEAVKVWSASNL